MTATYGDGDPRIGAAAQAAHDRAVAAGQVMYLDRTLGLYVMTTLALEAKGACCGNACRHCPFPAEAQRAAGRETVRP